jgi:hypothetical protein
VTATSLVRPAIERRVRLLQTATSAPDAPNVVSVRRSSSAERADTMTRQPSAANALAVANPMPRLEPVMRATLPVRFEIHDPASLSACIFPILMPVAEASGLRVTDRRLSLWPCSDDE